jgi:hypothetical protein
VTRATLAVREGQNPGEFGSGWNNSGYWAGMVGEHEVFRDVHAVATLLSKGSERMERMMQADHPNGQWNPKRFLGLCMMAVAESDDELLAFCGQVNNAMLRLTFDHVYGKL